MRRRRGLVPAELEERATASVDDLSRCRELRGELRGGLVTALLGEERVAADIGDQERPDLDVLRCPLGARTVGWERVCHAALCVVLLV